MKGSEMKPQNLPIDQDYCKDCQEVKPIEQFPKSPGSYCRKCLNERTKNNPNHKTNVRKNQLQKKYGITLEQYTELFQKQQGVCDICSEPEMAKGKQNLAVDHDHKTGIVRGLLCHNCNTALGKFMDNKHILKNAIFYLDRSEARLENKIRKILINKMEETK